MIGLAAAVLFAATSAAGPADGPRGPLSVAVQAGGGRDVSYAIVVRNSADHAVSDAVITQQLPPSLDYIAATPPPHRAGRHLSWTLAVPAHGSARITTTGAAGHRLGARPLDRVRRAGALHGGNHRLLMTTVCVREDTGPQACATGGGALGPTARSRWGRATLPIGFAGAALATLLAATRLRARRR